MPDETAVCRIRVQVDFSSGIGSVNQPGNGTGRQPNARWLEIGFIYRVSRLTAAVAGAG